MKTTFLDFEQPIAELEQKIEELRYVQDDSAVDISEEIERLQKKSNALTKDIYGKLSHGRSPRWRVIRSARTRSTTREPVHRFRGAARRPRLRRRCLDRRRPGAFRRGQPVMVIGHQKGRDTKEKIQRNFGMSKPEGYRKALRLMKLAEKFDLPVFTFVDTPGAYPGHRRRGARPVRGHRPQPVRHVAAQGADHHDGHRRGRLRRRAGDRRRPTR
jgi:acetyl-CoA carboxylase carboxyl transferase subunit alpha